MSQNSTNSPSTPSTRSTSSTPSSSCGLNASSPSTPVDSSPVDHYNAITGSQREYIEEYHYVDKKSPPEIAKILNIQIKAVLIAISQLEVDKKHGAGKIKVTDCE